MCSGLVFFSRIHPPKKIFFPPLSTAEQNTPKERERERDQIGVRDRCNAEEARVNNNELSCCWYRRERDRFLLSATTFSEYSLLVERVSRRAIVHLFKRVSNFFPSSICVDGAVEREKNHKNHVDEHIGRKKLPFKSSEIKEKNV